MLALGRLPESVVPRSLAASWIAVGCLAAAPPAVLVPDTERPSVLERVGAPPRLLALDVRDDGEAAIVAVLRSARPERTTLVLHGAAGEEPATLDIAGRVRALRLQPDGRIFALVHKSARKERRPGETALLRIGSDLRRPREVLRLPPSASDLAVWSERGLLLVACTNDLRSVDLGTLRSGPVFRIVGPNRAVASLGGSSAVLVGQDAELLLVALDDEPRDYRLPVRERVATPAPVADLASSRDGTRALARLEDGRVLGAELGPLRLRPLADAALAVVSSGPGLELRPALAPLPAVAPPAPQAADPYPVEAPPRAAPTTTAESDASTGAAAAPTSKVSPPQRAASPPVDRPLPGGATVRGRVEGPAAEQVRAVVLLGPDNIVREFVRVTPDGDGAWRADGVRPGRYRVQVDAGGRRVLVSDPPFLVVDVKRDGPETVEAGVLRIMRPR